MAVDHHFTAAGSEPRELFETLVILDPESARLGWRFNLSSGQFENGPALALCKIPLVQGSDEAVRNYSSSIAADLGSPRWVGRYIHDDALTDDLAIAFELLYIVDGVELAVPACGHAEICMADAFAPDVFVSYDRRSDGHQWNDEAGEFQDDPDLADRKIPLTQRSGEYATCWHANTTGLDGNGDVYRRFHYDASAVEFYRELLRFDDSAIEPPPDDEDDEETDDEFEAPTLDELQRRFHLYGRYRRTGSSDDALRFIEACQGLLEAKPISSSHGPDSLAFQAELRQLIAQAEKWIASNAGVENGGAGVKHVSFANFRD
jgi:hypothetical protein